MSRPDGLGAQASDLDDGKYIAVHHDPLDELIERGLEALEFLDIRLARHAACSFDPRTGVANHVFIFARLPASPASQSTRAILA
jgi:hypothetical protein